MQNYSNHISSSPLCSHPCCWNADTPISSLYNSASNSIKYLRSQKSKYASTSHKKTYTPLIPNPRSLSIIDMNVNCIDLPHSSANSNSFKRIRTSQLPAYGTHNMNFHDNPTLLIDDIDSKSHPSSYLESTPFQLLSFAPSDYTQHKVTNTGKKCYPPIIKNNFVNSKGYSNHFTAQLLNCNPSKSTTPNVQATTSTYYRNTKSSSLRNQQIVYPPRLFLLNDLPSNLSALQTPSFRNLQTRNLTDDLIAENYQDPSIIIKSYPKSLTSGHIYEYDESILDLLPHGHVSNSLQIESSYCDPQTLQMFLANNCI